MPERPAPRPADLAPLLLPWFERRCRDLPWRHTADPYRIWLAEVMLQQTQVSRVVGFYERFLAELPSVEAVAAAPLARVLRLWEGLGYYGRARSFHAACRLLVERHRGQVPADGAELRALPGIGEYTAGAVLSLAFGQAVPAIDTNGRRVLGRVFGLPAAAELRRLAAAAVPAEAPAAFNQAVFDLGAMVCLPREPRCGECPLGEVCRGEVRSPSPPFAEAMADEPRPSPLGRKVPVPAGRRATVAAALVRRRGRVLLVPRAPEGLWGGLWVLPSLEVGDGVTPAEALAEVLRGLGLTAEVGPEVRRLRYGVTGRRYELTVHECTARGRVRAGRWVRAAELGEYAMPAPHRRVVEGDDRQAGGATGRWPGGKPMPNGDGRSRARTTAGR